MEKVTQKRFWFLAGVISIVGLLLRFMGFPFESVDYQQCLSSWTEQLKAYDSIHALAAYTGDYNYPYITILYFLTHIPVPSLYSIKMISVLFDFLEAGVLASTAMYIAGEDKKRYSMSLIVYALVLCNPVTIINSSYLAQCESIWAGLSLLAFYLVLVREKPAWGMFVFGMALGFKLQAIFILPILLIFYFYKKKFSIFHILWIPIAIEVLCIPAIIGGCGWDSAITQYLHLLGEYPYMFYYYPNIWTFFQTAPYYIFGRISILFAFVTLLIFAVLFIKCKKHYTVKDYVQYAAWTAMTCTMLLPCMHERYNYLAEILLPVSAVFDRKLRLPALLLTVTTIQCVGQQFLGWTKFSYYLLAASNIIVYIYFSAYCLGGLYAEYRKNEGLEAC